MSGAKQPIELVIAKGSKHLTKKEIADRQAREIKPLTDDIAPPSYLTTAQKKEFNRISTQLQALKIMSATDTDALARFIIANGFYIHATKQLRKTEVKNNAIAFDNWSKIQERYFKQCRASANDLGLSISSRCKLVVPEAKNDTPKENKFKKFEKSRVTSG